MGHHHGSHTPTSPEAVSLAKMAHHTKQIRRECMYRIDDKKYISFPKVNRVNKRIQKSRNRRSKQNIKLQKLMHLNLYVAKFSGHNSTLICKKGVVNDEFKGSHKNQ